MDGREKRRKYDTRNDERFYGREMFVFLIELEGLLPFLPF